MAMARRRQQKRSQPPSAMTQLGLAWYSRERKCRIDMAARSEYVSYLLRHAKKDAQAPP